MRLMLQATSSIPTAIFIKFPRPRRSAVFSLVSAVIRETAVDTLCRLPFLTAGRML